MSTQSPKSDTSFALPPPQAKACHYEKIEAHPFGPEAPGVKMRVLIDDQQDGAPVYALRLFEVAPGGHTPDHRHAHEHENYVLCGRGQVRLGDEWHDLESGSVVFVPPGVRHQYRNRGKTDFCFLCGVPIPRLRKTLGKETQ